MQFEVEAVLANVGSGVVLARQTEAGDFHLRETSSLGGAAIHPHVSAPRALTPAGAARTDLFAFALRSRNDLGAFSVGQLVELAES